MYSPTPIQENKEQKKLNIRKIKPRTLNILIEQ